jgi:uncharacterized protein
MQEVYAIPIPEAEEGDKFIIYRPLIGSAFIGNLAMVDLVRNLAGNPKPADEETALQASRFLEGIGFLSPDIIPTLEISPLTSVVLLLTNQCQLRCIYCYASAGDSPQEILSIDTAKTVIDYVASRAIECSASKFRLEFHGGGEPTLVWSVLKEAVLYARRKPLPASISITTNAMWSTKQCEWIINNLDGVSISMDGAAETQNHNRPLSSGKPSFQTVIRNLVQMDEHKFKYGIRMTATRPWNRLKQNVQFIVENTSCRNIQVEPAFNLIRGQHGTAEKDEYQAFIERFIEAFEVAKSHKADFRYSGARPGMVTTRFCSAPFDALVVNPENEIVACYEVVNSSHPLSIYSKFGKIENGQVMIDQTAREKLHALMKERLDTCGSCFCKWTCGGDCFIRTFQPGADGHLKFGQRCEINREITRYLLLDLIADNEGVWKANKHGKVQMENQYG